MGQRAESRGVWESASLGGARGVLVAVREHRRRAAPAPAQGRGAQGCEDVWQGVKAEELFFAGTKVVGCRVKEGGASGGSASRRHQPCRGPSERRGGNRQTLPCPPPKPDRKSPLFSPGPAAARPLSHPSRPQVPDHDPAPPVASSEPFGPGSIDEIPCRFPCSPDLISEN